MMIYKAQCWCGAKPLDRMRHLAWHLSAGGTLRFDYDSYQDLRHLWKEALQSIYRRVNNNEVAGLVRP